MKYHKGWAILGVVTFAGHMIGGLYSDAVYYLAEYIWFASIVFAILAIYSGATSVARIESEQRGAAIASATIGGIVLLGLFISATGWLFVPEWAAESLM